MVCTSNLRRICQCLVKIYNTVRIWTPDIFESIIQVEGTSEYQNLNIFDIIFGDFLSVWIPQQNADIWMFWSLSDAIQILHHSMLGSFIPSEYQTSSLLFRFPLYSNHGLNKWIFQYWIDGLPLNTSLAYLGLTTLSLIGSLGKKCTREVVRIGLPNKLVHTAK